MGISKIIGILYKMLIKLLLFIIEITSKIPFSKVYVKTPFLYQIILYYLIIFVIRISFKNKKTSKNFKIQKANYSRNFNNNSNSKFYRKCSK